MKIITLLTDFGSKDPYVGQMKGIILSIAKSVYVIDITHEILPQNIKQGAFLMYSSVGYFPKNTIHLAVVDPGVGTSRKGLIIDCKDFILVGPDNGLLIPAAKKYGNYKVYEITNSKFFLDKVSKTFHGRDIFAPIAAHIANGTDPEEIGEETNEYVDFYIRFARAKENKIEGEILHIDRFGNLITNVEEKLILDYVRYGRKINLVLRNKNYKLRFLESYGYSKEKEILLTIGGLGFLEISVNKGSACKKLGAKIGDRFTLIL